MAMTDVDALKARITDIRDTASCESDHVVLGRLVDEACEVADQLALARNAVLTDDMIEVACVAFHCERTKQGFTTQAWSRLGERNREQYRKAMRAAFFAVCPDPSKPAPMMYERREDGFAVVEALPSRGVEANQDVTRLVKPYRQTFFFGHSKTLVCATT